MNTQAKTSQSLWSRDYFLMTVSANPCATPQSQSLWSRDYFLIYSDSVGGYEASVAIPLEQGLFFNKRQAGNGKDCKRRNPFGAGTIF